PAPTDEEVAGFDLDVLACPTCGGRLRLTATALDPQTIRAIVLSLGLPTAIPERAPPARSAFVAIRSPAGRFRLILDSVLAASPDVTSTLVLRADRESSGSLRRELDGCFTGVVASRARVVRAVRGG